MKVLYSKERSHKLTKNVENFVQVDVMNLIFVYHKILTSEEVYTVRTLFCSVTSDITCK